MGSGEFNCRCEVGEDLSDGGKLLLVVAWVAAEERERGEAGATETPALELGTVVVG